MRHNAHPPISLNIKGQLGRIWCYRSFRALPSFERSEILGLDDPGELLRLAGVRWRFSRGDGGDLAFNPVHGRERPVPASLQLAGDKRLAGSTASYCRRASAAHCRAWASQFEFGAPAAAALFQSGSLADDPSGGFSNHACLDSERPSKVRGNGRKIAILVS